MSPAPVDESAVKALAGELRALLKEKKCHPLVIRMAWHDSGTYDQSIKEFPERGGANGSIRFKAECDHGANAGVINMINLMNGLKEKYPSVTYADMYQLASALAIEDAGGPKIPLRFGRVDVPEEKGCAKEGRLPGGGAPYPDKAKDAAHHLRNVFHRMGFTDQEIVALSGAHTLGRAYPNRSGFGKDKTPYTEKPVAPGATVGGSSWTKDWLKFDNSYFNDIKEQADDNLLVLETDAVIFSDPKFRPSAEKYAADQDTFFNDYSKAHLKLSEVGSEWVEGSPVRVDY